MAPYESTTANFKLSKTSKPIMKLSTVLPGTLISIGLRKTTGLSLILPIFIKLLERRLICCPVRLIAALRYGNGRIISLSCWGRKIRHMKNTYVWSGGNRTFLMNKSQSSSLAHKTIQ